MVLPWPKSDDNLALPDIPLGLTVQLADNAQCLLHWQSDSRYTDTLNRLRVHTRRLSAKAR